MAKRRMFNVELMCSDEFSALTRYAQLLYLHLNLRADDDGLIGNVRGIMRGVGANNAHLNELMIKGYLIPFDSGIVAIRHWHCHNQIRKDRYVLTIHLQELSQLKILSNGIYIKVEKSENEGGKPAFFGNQMTTQYSIVKDSIDKDSTVQSSSVKDSIDKCSQVKSGADKDSRAKSSTERELRGTLEVAAEATSINKQEKKNKEEFDLDFTDVSAQIDLRRETGYDNRQKEYIIDGLEEILGNGQGNKDYGNLLPESEYSDSLVGKAREDHLEFISQLKRYFYSEYGIKSCDKFISYNESRKWLGKNGESVIANYKRYVKDWVDRDYCRT